MLEEPNHVSRRSGKGPCHRLPKANKPTGPCYYRSFAFPLRSRKTTPIPLGPSRDPQVPTQQAGSAGVGAYSSSDSQAEHISKTSQGGCCTG